MNYYKIAPLRLKLPPLIYKSPAHLPKNSIVKISIKNKIALGVVLDSASKPNFECEVAEQSEFFLTENQAILGRFVASYYCVSYGVAFGIMVLGKCGDLPLEAQNSPLGACDLHLGSHSVDLATRTAEFANFLGDSATRTKNYKIAETNAKIAESPPTPSLRDLTQSSRGNPQNLLAKQSSHPNLDSAKNASFCHIERSEISQNHPSQMREDKSQSLPLPNASGGLRGWVDSANRIKNAESNKNNKSITQKQINAVSLQISDSPKTQSLPNGLPRFCFAESRNDRQQRPTSSLRASKATEASVRSTDPHLQIQDSANAESWQFAEFASKAKQPSTNFCDSKNDKNQSCDSTDSHLQIHNLDSAKPSPNPTSKSLFSLPQKGLHPPTPLPPTRQKAAAFSLLGGRASLNPLLAKNRRLHYCNLESDFLHHEAGEIKGASHGFLLDSANAESKMDCHEVAQSATSRNDEKNMLDSAYQTKIAESGAISQNLIAESISQITHPRTPSAREGGQIADSAPQIKNAESNAKFAESPLDSADLPRLSCAQQGALDFIFSHPKTLLFGDTGSGKTEIYINAICATIAKNQSTIFLMPEIALTPQMEKRLKGVFGDLVCIWHSKISKAKKEAILANLDSAKIIAGARSALFLPVKNLGLIIVDEEHDEAYKSSTSPRYNARDLAIFLAQKQGIRLILGSATPSLNSYYNFSRENALFRLRGGYFAGERKISFDDEMLSQNMLDKIKTTLESKRQIIVFVPIRGNFKVLQCVSCGGGIKCENCAINLSLHSKRNALICHHCGFAKPFFDKRTICQSCGGDEFRALKIGTQEICKQLQNHFPHAKIAIFDRDEIKSEGKMRRILGEFNDKKIDILVGTQMISKGHDYHNAALVAIFGIDALLNSSDFRAYERAVSLLVQIAGRTGRKSDGEVVIETKNAKFFTRFMDDYEKFLKFELQNRANLYPPFRRIALLIAQNKDESKAKNILQNAKKIVESAQKNIEIIGLSKAPIERIEGRWRYFLLLRAKSAKELIGAVSLCKNLPLTIDIDPQQVV
ncbi:replication restart helicase PriA [Helicobacter sp. 23-1044]